MFSIDLLRTFTDKNCLTGRASKKNSLAAHFFEKFLVNVYLFMGSGFRAKAVLINILSLTVL